MTWAREVPGARLAWKEKHGGIIIQQLQKWVLCDWTRLRFTMDRPIGLRAEGLRRALHEGLIYKGKRNGQLDPAARTALSDEEVECGGKGPLWHSSTRCWTTMTSQPWRVCHRCHHAAGDHAGDEAVAVNPNDPRYNRPHWALLLPAAAEQKDPHHCR